jgi:lambda repressor-like predicted transcriptional regulator
LNITVNGDKITKEVNMDLNTYVKKTGLSIYSLSKKSGVPYMTLHNIIAHKSSIDECRVVTIKKIAEAIGVNPIDIISSTIVVPVKHHFIVDSVKLDKKDLPKLLRNFVDELEEYDDNNDCLFYAAADTMLLMANRFLGEGMIDQDTYIALEKKYPIA